MLLRRSYVAGFCYGLDDPGLNPGGGEIFCSRLDRPRDPPVLFNNRGTRSFIQGVKRPGRDVGHLPLVAPSVGMGRAIHLPLFCACISVFYFLYCRNAEKIV